MRRLCVGCAAGAALLLSGIAVDARAQVGDAVIFAVSHADCAGAGVAGEGSLAFHVDDVFVGSRPTTIGCICTFGPKPEFRLRRPGDARSARSRGLQHLSRRAGGGGLHLP